MAAEPRVKPGATAHQRRCGPLLRRLGRRRLAVALDVGGAIKGEVRADLYTGTGPDAGAEAGRVRHDLRMYRLVPNPKN